MQQNNRLRYNISETKSKYGDQLATAISYGIISPSSDKIILPPKILYMEEIILKDLINYSIAEKIWESDDNSNNYGDVHVGYKTTFNIWDLILVNLLNMEYLKKDFIIVIHTQFLLIILNLNIKTAKIDICIHSFF